MNGYQIGVAVYKDFGPFKEATIDFSVPGLTAIEGVIEGMPGCDDNGSGKSFLFDGIAWVFYGRCLRPKYDSDAVVRLGWDMERGRTVPLTDSEGTSVEVNLIGGPESIKVIRYRKHRLYKNEVRLFIGGHDVTSGTNPQTEAQIERLIGMDFNAFVNAAMFGCREDVKSFLSATDAGRKQMMEKLFGLELYADAQKIAQQELRALAPKLSELEQQKVQVQTRIATETALLDEVLRSDSSDDIEFKLNTAKLAHKAKDKAVGTAVAALSAAVEQCQKVEDAAAVLMQEHEAKADTYRASRTKLEAAIRQKENERSMNTGRSTTATMDKAKWTKLAGKECPTCQQAVAKKHVDTVSKRIDTELAEFGKVHTKLNKELADLQAKLVGLGDEPEPPELAELESARALVEAKEGTHRAAVDALEDAVTALRSAQDANTNLKERENQIRDTLAALTTESETLELELAERRAEADRYAFWVEGFGNGGVKSLLIERELPEINKGATGFAQRLLGPGTRIQLKATKALKTREATKEELSADVVIPGCTVSHAGASKGQKLRLDLSILLACRAILVGRSSKAFLQFFADELFDGVDATGCRYVVELLREIALEHPVCLVTHDPRIRQAATRVVRVHHSGGHARLLVNGGPIGNNTPVAVAKRRVRG